ATPPPYGVWTIREANVGGTRWGEELIAWEDPARWAWTVLRTSVPFAQAQVESFEFLGGSRWDTRPLDARARAAAARAPRGPAGRPHGLPPPAAGDGEPRHVPGAERGQVTADDRAVNQGGPPWRLARARPLRGRLRRETVRTGSETRLGYLRSQMFACGAP